MSYEAALKKAWDELIGSAGSSPRSVKFIADEYSVNPEQRTVLSLSCNVPAKEFSAILILHYLARKAGGLPKLTGDWVSFKELSGVEGYYPAFRKRAVEPVIRKYGADPQGLYSVLARIPGKRSAQADAGIEVEVFEGIPVLVLVWKGDDEFGPEANLLFDRSIASVFCTEDIVVLGGILAGAL